MKKNILIFLWTLAPVVLLAYHYGPGQNSLAREASKAKIHAAIDFEKKSEWLKAIDAYNEALTSLPDNDITKRLQLQLARANAQIHVGELPEAMLVMDHLLDEASNLNNKSLENKIRASLASTQYYAGWLMRLELAEKEEWMESIEKARQNFRLLAEESIKTNSKSHEDHKKNLEAVVRLARMDLSELQALPLPKKCQGNKNVCSKCRGQKKSNKPKAGQKREDARGSSVGKRPDGTGS